jgi:hypothetical protein
VRIKTTARLIAAAWLGGAAAAPAMAADYPYYRLNYATLDTTYEALDAQARRHVEFYWDGKLYCRYRVGWNGPGAYLVGTQNRPGFGWNGGYPWQGPGTPADHEDDQAFAEAQADYAREFGRSPTCDERPLRRRAHPVVLRRKG